MIQAKTDDITIAKHLHPYAGFRCALERAREAIERRGAVWYAVYRPRGVLLSGMTPAALRALTDLANSGEREDNMNDPRMRKHVEASRRRYASRRAAMIARPRLVSREVTLPDWPRGMREELAATYVGLSVSAVRAARTRADFPEPVRLTEGRIVYLREDLDAYLDRKAGRAPAAEFDWSKV